MNGLESKTDERTEIPTVEIKCSCGYINEVSLDKQGIKYQKCGGCHIYYEINTKIEINQR